MRCVTQYTRKVAIECLDGTVDAHGFIENTTDSGNWEQYTTSYARVESKGGREFWKVDKVDSDISHVWWCPYSRELAAATPDMRLVNEDVEYEIVSVIDIDLAHQEVEIQTRRAV